MTLAAESWRPWLIDPQRRLWSLSGARAVGLRVFDLAGRLLWKREEEGRAGAKVLAWAGDGADGGRVPPGTYIVELRIEGDGGDQTQRRIIAVVY